jgi:hypothetical protein
VLVGVRVGAGVGAALVGCVPGAGVSVANHAALCSARCEGGAKSRPSRWKVALSLTTASTMSALRGAYSRAVLSWP